MLEQKLKGNIENKFVFRIDCQKSFALKSILKTVFQNLSYENKILSRETIQNAIFFFRILPPL